MRVSVIIPAFNARSFIDRALESAAAQTMADLQIIVVDDASTDGTAARVMHAAATDPRITMVRQAVNGGPGAARNAGLAAARGEWVALLDADDAFHPQRLVRLLAIAAQTRADIVSDNLLLSPDNQPMFGPDRLPHVLRLTAANFVAGNTRTGGGRTSLGFMQPVFRRSFLQAHRLLYDPALRFGEDFVFCLRCLTAGGRWWVTPEPLYHYTVRPGSLTDSARLDDLRIISAYEAELLRRTPDKMLRRAVRRHKRTIDHWRYTKAFQAAFAGREYGAALRVAVENRFSLAAILRDALANSAPGRRLQKHLERPAASVQQGLR